MLYLRKLLLPLSILIILLLILISMHYHQQSMTSSAIPSLQHLIDSEGVHLAWNIADTEQIIINHYQENSSVHFIKKNNRWIFSDSSLPLEEIFILQLLQILSQTSLTPLSSQSEDELNIDLLPYYQLELIDHHSDRLTLHIAQPNATLSAHYLYLNDDVEHLFLVDTLLVQLIARPTSSYYAILLSELHTDKIKKFKIINSSGTIELERKPNAEFFSRYSFIEPYDDYSVDQERFHQEFLRWWQNRTPINVVYNYYPEPDEQFILTSGLKIPQATLEIQHEDGSSFSIAIGNLADEHHFYAKEIDDNAIWLIPDDLANSILRLKAFTISSRAILLPDIQEVNQIHFSNQNQSIAWRRDSSEIFYINNSKISTSVAKNLYESMLLLHYESDNLQVVPSHFPTLYEVKWQLQNHQTRVIQFFEYDKSYLYIAIDGKVTPFLIGKYQLEEVWQIWNNEN